MAKKNREMLKELFLNGLKPNQEDFADIIDSTINSKDDNIVSKNGKIGINTEDPKANLHVNVLGDKVKLGDKNAAFMVGRADGHNLSFDDNEIMSKNGNNYATLNIQAEGGDVYFHSLKTDIKERVIIKSNGKVGIGTNNPKANLHVNISGDKVKLGDKNAAFMVGNADGHNLSFDDNEIHAKNAENTATLFLQNDGGDLAIHNNVTERKWVVVKDDGKVGIGTKNPNGLLHIYTDNVDLVEKNKVGGGALIIGKIAGFNLAFDNNEIMAKENNTAATLYLNREGGNVYVGNQIINTSDQRLKEEIIPLTKGLKELVKLEPVSFKWKNREKNDDSRQYGFIAQKVEKIIKDITYTSDKYGTMGISSLELIAVLVKSVQEQQSQIKSLENRISKLEKLILKK